jgi:leucyl aminopeptidase (aminopeptidase T)
MSGDFDSKSWTQLASTLVGRNLALRRGQTLIIETWNYSRPLAEIIADQARHLGVRPLVFYAPEGSYAEPNASTRPHLAAIAAADAYVSFPLSFEDHRRLEPPSAAYRRFFNRRRQDLVRTLTDHSVPSVFLLAATATKSAARQFGVPPNTWRQECFRACAVSPKVLRAQANPLAKRLRSGRHVSITHPNGTNLELALLHRKPVIDDGAVDAQDLREGRIWTTIPSGFIVVAVDERFAEGRIVSNRPTRHRRGVLRGVSWSFRKGKLHSYAVEEGRREFEESYRKAGPERARPGYLSIGLNPAIRDFPLAEDQERGVVTVWIGRNSEFGGRTRGSYQECVLLEGSNLAVDGRPLLRAGRPI